MVVIIGNPNSPEHTVIVSQNDGTLTGIENLVVELNVNPSGRRKGLLGTGLICTYQQKSLQNEPAKDPVTDDVAAIYYTKVVNPVDPVTINTLIAANFPTEKHE